MAQKKPETADQPSGLDQYPTQDLSAAESTTTDPSIAVEAEAAEGNLAEELAGVNDRLLRLQAEMQNLRERTSREITEERRYAALPIVRDILPVVDNVDRAIEAAEKETDAESLLEGFRMVQQQLVSLLDRHHCKLIEAQGLPFDPDWHEAILQQPSADHAGGDVMMVTQTGYRLHDRVVRPAQVIVSSGPPDADAGEDA